MKTLESFTWTDRIFLVKFLVNFFFFFHFKLYKYIDPFTDTNTSSINCQIFKFKHLIEFSIFLSNDLKTDTSWLVLWVKDSLDPYTSELNKYPQWLLLRVIFWRFCLERYFKSIFLCIRLQDNWVTCKQLQGRITWPISWILWENIFIRFFFFFQLFREVDEKAVVFIF